MSTHCSRPQVLVILLGLGLAGCTGSIGDNPDSRPGGSPGEAPVEGAVACNDGRVVPGWVGTRRLNRTELNNTLRDLLGETSRPADALPADVALDGFDTVAEGG